MGKKRVLICGASGFIGRNIFEALSKRNDLEVVGTYNTRCFLPDNPKVIQACLTDKNVAFEITKGVDVLIQAAATTSGAKETFTKPYYHVTDNAVMNSLLFRAAHENHVPQVLFFSCSILYPSLDIPLKETDVDFNEPIHDKYFGAAWTKIYIEKLCEFWSRLGRTQFTVVRHSNIYGPYDKFDLERSHVFGATVAKVMTATDGIVIWGEGAETRDLLYVSDLVRFVESVVDGQDYPFDVFNVGLGESISVADLARKIIQLSGKNLEIEFDRTKPTLPTKLCLDFSKARQKFGWSPQVTLEEGIRKTMEWYQGA